jgi:hypothetical protein
MERDHADNTPASARREVSRRNALRDSGAFLTDGPTITEKLDNDQP